jgi:hypothetical protein
VGHGVVVEVAAQLLDLGDRRVEQTRPIVEFDDPLAELVARRREGNAVVKRG